MTLQFKKTLGVYKMKGLTQAWTMLRASLHKGLCVKSWTNLIGLCRKAELISPSVHWEAAREPASVSVLKPYSSRHTAIINELSLVEMHDTWRYTDCIVCISFLIKHLTWPNFSYLLLPLSSFSLQQGFEYLHFSDLLSILKIVYNLGK